MTTARNPAESAAEGVIKSVQALTVDSQVVLEAGKKLFTDSVETARDTCKFLVTLSSSAIPIYVALLRLLVPEGFPSTQWKAVLTIVPGLLFLASIIGAAFGLRPLPGKMSPSIVEEILSYREKLLRRRANGANIGFWLFFAGVVVALAAALVLLLSTPHSQTSALHLL